MMPATLAIKATRPSPMIVAPVKISTRFMATFMGLTTISSVPRTSSTSKQYALHGDHQAGNDRQRQRHAHDHRMHGAERRVDRQRAFEELDVRFNHVHADSPA